jgi:hypothetical protein
MTRGSSLTRSLVFAVIALAMMPPSSAAQETTLPDGVALGVGVDQFLYEGERLTAVTFRFSELRARTLGPEISVGVLADPLSSGAVYLAPDLGAAFNASGPGVTVLVKGGISTVAEIGGGFLPGYHLGSGLVVQTGRRWGIRLDVVRHVYLVGDGAEPIWSVGLGFTGLARRAT